MMECHTNLGFTSVVTVKLRNFGMAQQALARELLEAKQLGICRITTSEGQKSVIKSLDLINENGPVSMKIDIILTKEGSKETLYSKKEELR